MSQGHTRLRRLDQFHPTIAYGDAVSNDCFELQRELWAHEIRSELGAGRALPEVAKFVRHYGELLSRQASPDEALLVHHSMGNPAVEDVIAWPGRKIVRYHNITPAEYFAGLNEEAQHWSRVGREQLARLGRDSELGIGDSEYNCKELEAVGFARTAVVPLLLDLAALDVEPDGDVARTLAAGGTVILYVGQLLPHKGVHHLVEAFARYRGSDPAAVLYLVGSSAMSGSYLEELRRSIARLGLEGCVRLAGSVSLEELVAYYRGASVFVTLSEHEGFGIPAVEAMHLGVPVVAHAAAALPETVGDAGVLLEDRSPDRVAAALERAARDETLRRELIAKGRRRAAAFSRKHVVERFAQVLDGIGLPLPPPQRRRVALLTSSHEDDAHAAARALADGLRAHGHEAELLGVRRADNGDLAAKVASIRRVWDAVIIEHEFGIFRELRFVEALARLRLRGLRVVLSLRELEPTAFHHYRLLQSAVGVSRRHRAPALELLRLALLSLRVAWRFLVYRLVAFAMGALPARLIVHSQRAREHVGLLTMDGAKVEQIPALAPPLETPPPRSPEARRALRARLGLPGDAFVYISPGYFYRARRFLDVIAAAPEDACVVLCGLAAETDPGYRDDVKRHVEKHRLGNVRVEEDPALGGALLAASDCVVLFDEAVFQTDNAARAMAAGLPCVFADLDAYRLYEGAGLYAGDREALRSAMQRVREPDTYASLRRQTRVLRRLLSPERNAMRYLVGLFE